MVECKSCKKCFRDNYKLTQHMSRKVTCIMRMEIEKKFNEKNLTKKSTLDPKIDTLGPKIDTLDPKKSTLDPKIDTLDPKIDTLCKCRFCLNTFSTIWYKNKHQTICKYRDDPVRLLEIENKKDICLPESKTECRFCNKEFSRPSLLTNHLLICKKREEYHQTLKKEKETIIQNIGTLNNGTINGSFNNTTTTTNNITINNFGQESLDHIKTERLIQMLRDLSLDYKKDEVYLSAGEFINLVNKYIREVPENNNFILPSERSLYAEIKTPSGMERVQIDKYLNKSFKTSAKTILDKRESINNENERVFKSETNKEIFSEVKGFADNGFRHTPKRCIGTPRQVKSSYKIGMIKREDIDVGF